MDNPQATPAPLKKALMFGVPLAVIAVILLIGVMLVGWIITAGNRMISLQENTKSSWAQVETVLQRRYDLIPNLVATVKGYATHEQETLEKVTELRTRWQAAKTVDEKAAAASALEGPLARLLVISENYPELKADKQFQNLQFELAGTENRIAVERQRFNETVKEYNSTARQFPGSFVASFRGLPASIAYFESAPTAKEAPKVDFSKETK